VACAVFVRRFLHRGVKLHVSDLAAIGSTAKSTTSTSRNVLRGPCRCQHSGRQSTRVLLPPQHSRILHHFILVRLLADDASGNPVSSNFYWLSNNPTYSTGRHPTSLRELKTTPTCTVSRNPPAGPGVRDLEFRTPANEHQRGHVQVTNTSSQLPSSSTTA